jgi:hypothetical protein
MIKKVMNDSKRRIKIETVIKRRIEKKQEQVKNVTFELAITNEKNESFAAFTNQESDDQFYAVFSTIANASFATHTYFLFSF